MILKTPPFEDMIRKLRQRITLSQWSKLCDNIKDKNIDPKFIHAKDGFVTIDTSKYLEEDIYGPFEMRLQENATLSKSFTYDLKDGIRIVVRFNYGSTLGQVWDLEASCGDFYSIRVPMLRKDGCYAGAKGPIIPQYESSGKRRKK